ncbi:MAG: hypothetical protein Q4C56_03570 [Peptococcaceae bacterium]|nr:hypothetical protein [Peptococcaceae bacterium]
MGEQVDLRNLVEDEYCQDVKEVATKVGVTVVCDDEDVEAQKKEDEKNAIHMQDFEGCDNVKETASRFGVQVVCDDEE